MTLTAWRDTPSSTCYSIGQIHPASLHSDWFILCWMIFNVEPTKTTVYFTWFDFSMCKLIAASQPLTFYISFGSSLGCSHIRGVITQARREVKSSITRLLSTIALICVGGNNKSKTKCVTITIIELRIVSKEYCVRPKPRPWNKLLFPQTGKSKMRSVRLYNPWPIIKVFCV